jgi:hypothetical protein
MTKNNKRRIDSIYKIFALRKSLEDEDSVVTVEGYLKYLERLYIWFLGYGNEEVYSSILGLKKVGTQANVTTVKNVVLHMINLLEKGG